jgi:N-acetylglucosaminyl-diphospho-decaprenol L-rhamnosyltransferase
MKDEKCVLREVLFILPPSSFILLNIMLDLAIVIVNYNVCDLLRDCLRSVYASVGLALGRPLGFEVCVVDNASPDDSASMVAREFPQAMLIRNAENLGYAAANNLGLRYFGFGEQGSGIGDQQSAISNQQSTLPRYALLLNPDTVVPSDAFAQMIQIMDQNPSFGVSGPRLVRLDGSLDLACRRGFPTVEVSFWRLTRLSKVFPNSRRFGRYNMTYLDENQPAEIDSVVGAFMLVRREAIQQAGLLDEVFWMYGEDLDWAYRIKQGGWRVYYYPQVVVQHRKRASSGQSTAGAARAKYEFDRAMWLFYRKHYQAATPRPIDALVRWGLGLKGGPPLRAEMKSDRL